MKLHNECLSFGQIGDWEWGPSRHLTYSASFQQHNPWMAVDLGSIRKVGKVVLKDFEPTCELYVA